MKICASGLTVPGCAPASSCQQRASRGAPVPGGEAGKGKAAVHHHRGCNVKEEKRHRELK